MERNNMFAAALENESRWTLTENGAVALNTTGEACLDLFSTIGSLRDTNDIRVCRLFEDAYREDPLLATKILFYSRDVRGGLGERKTFRTILKYAADHHPEAIKCNIPLIGFYGRFDDLYSLIGTGLEDDMWKYMKSLFISDLYLRATNQPCSLLAKWIKTPDASSANTRAIGILTAKKLGYSVYDFKRLLRKLRKYIDVLEVKMSTGHWDEINYEAVPSRAMMLYRHAFGRHDFEGFGKFLKSVERGEATIHASTLYPYDLVGKALGDDCWGFRLVGDPVVEAQWKALPNYVEPGTNAIVIADTSGSMMCSNGRPLYSALGLAIYFAERNTGAYHNLFMSFSGESRIHELRGETLVQKLQSINMNDWGRNTNLKRAFEKILGIATKNQIPAEEMVKSIIVISDMEIDYCGDKDWTFYDQMKQMYADAGYEIPNVIFWNVNSRSDVFHADSTRKGVQLVSGQSASTFQQLVGSIGMTPIEMMLKVINSGRYDLVKIYSDEAE